MENVISHREDANVETSLEVSKNDEAFFSIVVPLVALKDDSVADDLSSYLK